MLIEFTLANFKSYKTGHLPLGSLTVLIGANAAGKSNALEGLRLLSWLAQGQKLSSIQYAVNSAEAVVRGRVNDLCYHGHSSFTIGCRLDIPEWNELNITLSVRDGELHISSECITNSKNTVLYELDQPSQGINTDVGVAYNNFTMGQNKPKITCSDQMAIFMQLDSPGRFDVKYEKSQKIIPETVREYQRVLQNILFLDPIPAKMREYSFKSDQRLQEDGKNLSSVLYRLWQNQPENQQTILNFIQSLPEQAIDGLDFLIGPRDEVMVQLAETFGDNRRYYEAALLSDGTLRVLAIAAAMLSATEGSLVVIEEIDNGVHPNRAKHLLASIRDIAERRKLRVLLSTHNPALMDALPDVALGDVVFCFRDPEEGNKGNSRLVRLRDMEDYSSLILQGPLGQLVTTGVVDRFVKSPHTPEDRKQQALAWLSRLQEYSYE
ncbi:AAA family ATPase [Dolichospermum circinale]|uniref:AAA family ATPase n=1 Tax=Dolichospermum circinale TaxID=109265 RepID=UPI000406A0BB|nr:ATP-binding protein [Dolichospermum circinale]MDB9473819.1 ATP-binding protein [Dolichospermum circinale CS-537/11]MDB9477865.1 ATP-binding protein [Dolichospermum circinale CS-537/03]MDB9481950.1 ATP-binding protein [Dolichospermum circinale CS-537/05]MDB9492513.1 ATP-binding protein [Dolichospermum circinale CS-534/05]